MGIRVLIQRRTSALLDLPSDNLPPLGVPPSSRRPRTSTARPRPRSGPSSFPSATRDGYGFHLQWRRHLERLLHAADYLAGSGQSTIPIAIYEFVGQYTTNWPLIFASLIISMIPILTLYLIFQRYVIKGFAGGLKG